MDLRSELDNLLTFIPKPLRDPLLDAFLGQARAALQQVTGPLITAAVPAVVTRMVNDGWDPVGHRDQLRNANPEASIAIRDAIRGASFLLVEKAEQEHGFLTGADVPADLIRDEEDTAVLDAVTPRVSAGMAVSDLVPLVAQALTGALDASEGQVLEQPVPEA